MTTRRENLPSHPNRIERMRALVRERDVTVTDVTQFATEILTDQDFLITTPAANDLLVYNGSKWVNQQSLDLTGSIEVDGQIIAKLGDVSSPGFTFTGALQKGFYATSTGVFVSLDNDFAGGFLEAAYDV